MFYPFTACSRMSLQIECSVEKSVTNRAAKRLENCFNSAQVAYVVVVSQHLQCFRTSAHFVW